MTISPLPQPYTQTFASSTTCGRKHRKRGDQLHLNEDRCGEFTVKLNTGELVRAFYVLDGHGETIPKISPTAIPLIPLITTRHPHSTFSSHGQRYVNLVQVLLPTVLTTLLDSALSASPSDMDPLVTHLSLFHEEIDTRAQAVNPNLCVENGSTALLSFILRDTLYVLSVGDSAALLMHEGVPVRVWRRCGIQEDGGVCSWPDSVDGFPNVTKEGW
ncbi:hypothetical protein BC936DRAFT_144693 [Jimgerdemannia flammicorona]|uniref:PPM-type phosphatase domain-containing protein n=1 Tax=Jimgerdemannia flammicorona TaxID=994334 RepID=A0A433DBW7_9FUNG|nr:hypothetical protein BC936DRAFT_144693 [Jimgerdemannia flammicorona]